jgi:hypothetical protein
MLSLTTWLDQISTHQAHTSQAASHWRLGAGRRQIEAGVWVVVLDAMAHVSMWRRAGHSRAHILDVAPKVSTWWRMGALRLWSSGHGAALWQRGARVEEESCVVIRWSPVFIFCQINLDAPGSESLVFSVFSSVYLVRVSYLAYVAIKSL